VAIVGAGPYGLAAKAALHGADVDVRMFGAPMSFWRERMPVGMLIRSPWVASSFAAPGSGLTLDDYERSLGQPLSRRLPLEHFIAYGEWFQRRACSGVDERTVSHVSANGSGFRLQLADGERLTARRVVVAAGIERFAARPRVFDDVPFEAAIHTTQLTDPKALSGSRVVVIGGGQSALESAALLHEAGAEVKVLVRAPRVHWLLRSDRLHRLAPVKRLLYAPSDIGPAGVSRLVTFPDAFARIPRRTRERLDRRAIRPAGSGWLVPRLAEVPIETGVDVVAARSVNGGVSLRLSSGQSHTADQVVLGTGFRIDLLHYRFLAPELARAVRCVNGYPILSHSFESSIQRLYFVGAIAAGTFGPLLRFVAGADFAARRVGRDLVGARPLSTPSTSLALESV
jgi:FAD-dependent urate hydroxylase